MTDTQTGSSSEATWGQVLRSWWLLSWRGLAGLLLIGVIVGGAIRAVFGNLGASQELQGLVGMIFGLLIFLLWGHVVVRMALNKRYRDFDLKLTVR